MKLFLILWVLNVGNIVVCNEELPPADSLPTTCHVCKHTVAEFLEELSKSENSKDVLQLGHIFQSGEHKKIVYNKSNLRLIEALENTCANMDYYKVHKDRPLQLRYAKEESSTFRTLKALKGRGVKVDLGFPDEMWDIPDAEVYRLKGQCEIVIERHEEFLSDWYYNNQEKNLYNWFCKDVFLKEKDQNCFESINNPYKKEGGNEKEMKMDDVNIEGSNEDVGKMESHKKKKMKKDNVKEKKDQTGNQESHTEL